MDRILFIIPPYVTFDSFINPSFSERSIKKVSGEYGSVVTDMPIGLISLSSYIKAHHAAEIRLIDFNIILNKLSNISFQSFAELYREILSLHEWREFAPNIIGVSALFTPSYANMLDIGQVSREIFPESLIISGGGVPTNMYCEIFRDSNAFDALCYGEGELPLLKLLVAENKSDFLNNNPSWVTKSSLQSNQQYEFDFITDLDEIPFYDYDLLTIEDYSINPTISTIVAFENKSSLFHLVTSRGCTHLCCYCASHTVHGRTMRYHSFERVQEDLTLLKNRYGAALIGVQDDNFMADKRRALKIIDCAKSLNLKIFFQSGLPLYALDRNMLEAIKHAGIKELVLAIESGSNRVLREIMHKPLDLSIVNQVIKNCRELGIDTDANILIGLPGETKQDIEDTRLFLRTLDATWFRIYVATPLVGSEMLEICLKNNYLKGNYIGCDFKKAVVETEDFSAEYIQEKAYSLNLELNFVENSDMRLGNFEAALKGFENTIKIKNDHALALYFAAECYQKLNNIEKHLDYKAAYMKTISESEFWRTYAQKFGLPVVVEQVP